MEREEGSTLGAVRLVTIPMGAREVGVGIRQLRRAIDAGELAVYDVGSWPRIAWGDLLAWVQKQRRHQGTAPTRDRSR